MCNLTKRVFLVLAVALLETIIYVHYYCPQVYAYEDIGPIPMPKPSDPEDSTPTYLLPEPPPPPIPPPPPPPPPPGCGPDPDPDPPDPPKPDHPDDTLDVSTIAPELFPSPNAEIAILQNNLWRETCSFLQALNIKYAIHKPDDIPSIYEHPIVCV